MLSTSEFVSLVVDPAVLNRPINRDPGQQDAVIAPLETSLFVVAGPGSGKTTVLTLRVLKLIFVDGLDPASILATTFTKKAASELRSRILGWGDRLRQAILAHYPKRPGLASTLQRLDVNRIVTGTLDSIAEEILSDFREPGVQPPVPLEEFVANALMLRAGLWNGRRDRDTDFQDYVKRLRGETRPPNRRAMIELCREIRDRFVHDQIDMTKFEAAETREHRGASLLCRVVEDYVARLQEGLVMDFAGLEAEFLRRLEAGSLSRFTDGLRVVLVDEYQDTNLLQEQIYFALARGVRSRGGSITVVGDDDQSLYRFRGATVELFADFSERLASQCGIEPRPVYLTNNYRSTTTIVNVVKDFVALDPAYQPARVRGKPPLAAARCGTVEEFPVLAMFRPSVDVLARDLARFLDKVFRRDGIAVRHNGRALTVVKDPDSGAIGDCVLLCSSVREYSSGGNPRLPLLLRQELEKLRPKIQVFNPRGREFCEIPDIQRVCGLMLECVDPHARVQQAISTLPQDVVAVLDCWRNEARTFIALNPPAPVPARTNTLKRFVDDWQTRTSKGRRWPREVPLIELLYRLVTWIPALQFDPEGLVYLEAISRTITQSASFSTYGATVRRDPPWADRSITAIIWDVFVPIAAGEIEIDEELVEELPRDRLNILSIHQAKGLEFPLVIVDVSSDFNSNHWAQAFKRFPRDGGRPHLLEDRLRRFSPLSVSGRSPRDRAFDDLVRQYFVAFSRPQDVLMLVGLSGQDREPKEIPNVALGWTRDETWRWRDLPGVVKV